MLIVITKELISYAIGISNSWQLFVSLFSYLVIAGTAYCGFKCMDDVREDFWNNLKFVFLLFFAVQIYRTFFDYTFWGIKPLELEGEQYSSLFQYGGLYFRPSSLESPIIYSVELALFLGYLLFHDGFSRENWLWFVGGGVSLLLTNSRTGMIILALAIIGNALFKKQYKTTFGLLLFAIMIITILGKWNTISSIFDLSGGTYVRRISSIQNTVNTLRNMSPLEMLFGMGFGAANYIQENNQVMIYVEDFYFALIANSGFITTAFFFVFCICAVFVGLLHKNNSSVLLISLLIGNIVACSLLNYTIQLFFWILSFSLLETNKEKGWMNDVIVT